MALTAQRMREAYVEAAEPSDTCVLRGEDLEWLVSEIVVGKDTVTQYYPWYSYLGERLRSGDIPAWNPYQFSGAPFAADPLSGWTYLPAMILFTILPVSTAAGSYLFVHLLLAG